MSGHRLHATIAAVLGAVALGALALVQLSAVAAASKPSSHIYSLSRKEFKDKFLCSYEPTQPRTNHTPPLTFSSYPAKWDWREKGVVSNVKNQKSCGGCWAFSVSGTLESALSIKEHSPASNYSVQEVLDCSSDNSGCEGGSTCSALSWLQEGGVTLVPESVYPLTDKSEKCHHFNQTAGIVLTKYTCLSKVMNESIVPALIYEYGPLIAGVDASTWNEYMGGIIQFHCGTSINHAIQIVGYDLTGDVPYYIVRNSWGSDWGHHGYVYIKHGANTCGITQDINVVITVQRRG